jgi:hypothetical protein
VTRGDDTEDDDKNKEDWKGTIHAGLLRSFHMRSLNFGILNASSCS